MGGTTNSDEMEGTGLENAEKHGSKRGMKMKKHGEAFEREDENEKDDLDTKRK